MIQIVQGRGSFLDLMSFANRVANAPKTELASLAREAKADLVQTLREPKSGRIYGRRTSRFYKLVSGVALRKSKATKEYRASAPGEAPAPRTGALARSVRSVAPRVAGGLSVVVFADRRVSFFRHMLEFGTSKAAARPFIAPLVEHYAAIAPERIEAAVDRSVDTSGFGPR
ncbi:MAG: hypothetical protein GC202_02075 [Alphaproteobacteria bacterium]|nr:hypothetical protein [Alphaproteobacteria bacterium]